MCQFQPSLLPRLQSAFSPIQGETRDTQPFPKTPRSPQTKKRGTTSPASDGDFFFFFGFFWFNKQKQCTESLRRHLLQNCWFIEPLESTLHDLKLVGCCLAAATPTQLGGSSSVSRLRKWCGLRNKAPSQGTRKVSGPPTLHCLSCTTFTQRLRRHYCAHMKTQLPFGLVVFVAA